MCGNSLEVLPSLPPESIDAIVSDPPYGLSFMGKEWDHGVPGEAFWREALRVAKPGAHLVAFGGTRTYHRLTCAIEDAGWEVRDCLMWLYGSGFPKSLDVSKAIDKRRDDRDDICRVTACVRAARDRAGLTNALIDATFDTNGMAGHWTSTGSQPAVPTWEQWERLKELLALGNEMDAEVWRLNGRKGAPGEAWHEREVVGERVLTDATKARLGFSGPTHSPDYDGTKRVVPITVPASDAAREWEGWGTALKPAWEPIILARKPLREPCPTVAENVLAHGTGALNIDGCRIGADTVSPHGVRTGRGNSLGLSTYTSPEGYDGSEHVGRWPANLVHDEQAAAVLDAEAGAEVARFFYCAKASRAEREAGCETLPRGVVNTETPPGTKGANSPRAGAGRSGAVHNHHPTVKPIALMRWLVRLVTPPGGHVLDPFNGSGTTGCAAVLEGMRYTGIDLSEEYVAIARARIAHWEAEAARERAAEQPSLFPAA